MMTHTSDANRKCAEGSPRPLSSGITSWGPQSSVDTAMLTAKDSEDTLPRAEVRGAEPRGAPHMELLAVPSQGKSGQC